MQLAELLAQIDELKAEIEGLRPLKPEVERRIMQKFRLDWNYHSNAIEGNTLTLGETRAFLMEGLTANGKPLKDHLDIKGHNQLLDFLEHFIHQTGRLTEAEIREMHKILLKEPYEVSALTSDGLPTKKTVRLGEYKQEQNGVKTATGEIHYYSRPEEVPMWMSELLKWYEHNETTKETHPLVIAAVFHHKFLAIHPFDDGNGRMGRILMNLILMRHGYPPAIIKLNQRDQYVAALRRADGGELVDVTSFIAQSLIDSMMLYLRGAKGESIDDADDVDKAVMLLKKELSTVPKPTELDLHVQQEHFSSDFLPLLQRVLSKLNHYNDLFSGFTLQFSYQGRNPHGSPQQNSHSYSEQHFNQIQDQILKLNESGIILTEIQWYFNWSGFLKDGPNDFSVGLSFRISYDLRKMHLRCETPLMNKLILYQKWMTEDECREFVNGLNKSVLDYIKQNLEHGKSSK